MNENNSTTNAILIILVVIVVGFIVWFVMARSGSNANLPDQGSTTNNQNPALQINVGTTSGSY